MYKCCMEEDRILQFRYSVCKNCFVSGIKDVVRRQNTKMLVFCLQELLQYVSGMTDVVRRQNTKMLVFCCKNYFVSGRTDVIIIPILLMSLLIFLQRLECSWNCCFKGWEII
jgi:hypothetical protein